MMLSFEAVVPVSSDKHHGHPIISGVTQNLFRASATYNLHNFDFSCRTIYRGGECLPRATKKRYG
jgi:hypothetical protein